MIQPHRTLIIGLVWAMLWLLAPLGAAAPMVRLSLSQALAQVRQRNPGVAVAQARVSVAEGMKTAAGLIPNPVLTLTSENSPLGSQPFQFSRDTDDYAFLTQTIELGGKRSRRVKLEDEKVRQTALEGEIGLRELVVRTGQAYWGAAGAARVRDLYNREVATLDQIVEYNRARVGKGATAAAELIRIKLESYRLQAQARDAAQAAVRTAIALYGEMGSTDFPAAIDFADRLEVLGEIRPPSIETVLRERPEMRLAREAVKQAQANLDLQHANAIIDPNLLVGYKRWSGPDPQNSGLNTLYFGMQVPLPLFNRNQGQIAAAAGGLRAANAALAVQEIAVRAQVAAALDDYRMRRAALLDIMPKMNSYASETFSIAEGAYRLGAADILRFLDAERARIETEVLYVQALTQYHQSAVNLQFATGTLR
jgi:cobalt-zinc-cadmium efflux system outer membrane protein